jgi:hypothetical protein
MAGVFMSSWDWGYSQVASTLTALRVQGAGFHERKVPSLYMADGGDVVSEIEIFWVVIRAIFAAAVLSHQRQHGRRGVYLYIAGQSHTFLQIALFSQFLPALASSLATYETKSQTRRE